MQCSFIVIYFVDCKGFALNAIKTGEIWGIRRISESIL